MSSIIVVFPKVEDAKSIRNLLVRHGFTVAGVCTTGAQALNYVDSINSGIIVCGYRLPDMLYSQLQECLPPGFEMMLLVSQRMLQECQGSNIVYVSMPLKVHDLIDTMSMMEQSITRKRKKKRAEKPKERPTEEKLVIEKAKEILMKRNNMSEEEAHRYIQKTSMDSGNSMLETAEMVITIMQQ